MDSYNSPTTAPIYRVTQIIWYILYYIEAILILRFALKLFAANPQSGFVSFMYGITGFLVSPFLTAFGITKVMGSSFEWPTLLAIVKLLLIGKTVSTPEAAAKLNKEEDKINKQ